MKFVKITKKMQILLIFSSLIAITFFSCASTPKEEDLSLQNQSEINENENQTENKKKIENSQNQNKPENNENLYDLEEPLTNEQNPDLPELPEVQNNENVANNNEPVVITEPDVKDVPISETDNKNSLENEQDEKNQNSQNKQNGQTALSESLNNNENNNENTFDSENNNSENNNSEVSSSTEIEDETENQKENSELSENQNEPGTVETIPVPSRSVSMKKNQIIDITYPGKGWIYQGNIDSDGNVDSRSRNFIFNGRKLGGKDTSFTLRSRNAGTYLLHFFKNDTLTGNYIDDYLEVVVQDENNSSTEHITAPNYAEVVPPKATITADKIKEQKKVKEAQEAKNENSLEKEKSTKKEIVKNTQNKTSESENASAIDTIIQTTESAPNITSPVVSANAESNANSSLENLNSAESAKSTESSANFSENQNLESLSEDALLDTAQKYYDEKKYPEAFTAISKFFDKATKRLDEGLYLQGRILEEKSSVQNIKNAIESYDLVVNNYPSSSLWDKANKRSIFLKRFYINIR